MSVGLDLDVDVEVYTEGSSVGDSFTSFWDIVPREGVFLGLDISKNSTGVTFIENGEKITGNVRLDDIDDEHREVLLRRQLKSDLSELIEGKHFDLIVIEDAFVGENPDTVRLLFALNTAIDEMILDGICSCDIFLRVSNKSWKSWLTSFLDKEGFMKGYNDKEKIRFCLEKIGVFEEGEGYQDRLDSTGLIVGYFLKGKGLAEEGKLVKKKKVRFSDIEGAFDIDQGYLFFGRDDVDRSKAEYLDCTRISKKRVIELLTENPDTVYITDKMINIGNLGIELGLEMLGSGYFAFWVNPKRIRKYLEVEK